MQDLFSKLLDDETVLLTSRKVNEPLGRLVNQLPEILVNNLNEVATVESVMRAQHTVLQTLIDGHKSPPPWLLEIASTTSQHAHADLFLRAIGKTRQKFWREMLSETEAEAVESGQIKIRELLERRPKVFIYPILWKMKITRH